jgi:hypothetical protein
VVLKIEGWRRCVDVVGDAAASETDVQLLRVRTHIDDEVGFVDRRSLGPVNR